MKKIACITWLVASAWAQPQTCPQNTEASDRREGNTRIFTCLDNQGRPHGPFTVRVYPDSSASGVGTLSVKGFFRHGKQDGEWITFAVGGQGTDIARFEDGNQVEEQNAP